MRRLVIRVSATLLLTLAIVMGSVGQRVVRADDAKISVTNQKTENKWRQYFKFHVSAASTAGKITSARVIVKDLASDNSRIFLAEKFAPSVNVDLTATWDVTTEATPPFSLWRYVWEISDDAGNTFDTDYTQFELADDTHPWKNLSSGQVRVYWYGNDDAFGQKLLDSAVKGYEHVSKATNYTPNGELRVIMYPTQKDFFSFSPSIDQINQESVGGFTVGTITVEWNEASEDPTDPT